MKFAQSFAVLALLTLTASMAVRADTSGSDTPGPGCFGTFSDIDHSVPGEGIVVSMKDSKTGEGTMYEYGLLHMGNNWVPVCPITLPSSFPDEIVITLAIPTPKGTPVFDSMWLDPELGDGRQIELQKTETPVSVAGIYRTVVQVQNFLSAYQMSTTGYAMLIGKMFDSSVSPENYLGQLIIPIQGPLQRTQNPQ